MSASPPASPPGITDPTRCAHCGLPVLSAPRRKVAGPFFCCLGCRLAAAVAGGEEGPRRFLEARLLISAFLAMGVMTFSLVLYGEAVYTPEEDPGAELVRTLGRFFLAAFSLPVMLLLGVPLTRGAWNDLRQGRVRMDGLILLATLAAFALSLFHTLDRSGEVYYETATMVLVLVTFGRRLEAQARTQGKDAAQTLQSCLPERAHRVTAGGELLDVPPRELERGHVVRILPGELVPADVVVLEGRSEARAAHLTGEETLVVADVGAALPAGAVNGRGLLEARVVAPAASGSLGRIVALLEAPLPATRTIRIVDRLAGWLAAAAMILAFLGGLRSGAHAGVGAGLRTGLSVLLVACPCALGLAIPLAYRALRASLARQGVLVNDPTALEVMPSVDTVLLDKTGTLTAAPSGGLRPVAGGPGLQERLRSLVAHSGHALATSLVRPLEVPRDLEVVPGLGVAATLAGTRCRAGRPEWLDSLGMQWEPEVQAQREKLASDEESSLIAYAEGAEVRALAVAAPALRPEAVSVVAGLRRTGLRVEIVSGDRQASVDRVAAQLGTPGRGKMLPEDKVKRIQELRQEGGRILLAGDGINDAPALRAADVGVALASGTAAARAEAQVEILGDDLSGLARFREGALALRRVVRGNLVWTLAFNGVALALATAGHLHPLVAAVAMIASSLAVSLRSVRLLSWGEALP